MDAQSDMIEREAVPRRADSTRLDGVSSDAGRQPVASFLDKLDTVGDGLSILSEMLDALRGDQPGAGSAAQPMRPSLSPLPQAAEPQAVGQRTHRDVLKHHQDLFSLLRRIAQREMAADMPVAATEPKRQPQLHEPLSPLAPQTLFLGKLNVPPVDPQYRRLARR